MHRPNEALIRNQNIWLFYVLLCRKSDLEMPLPCEHSMLCFITACFASLQPPSAWLLDFSKWASLPLSFLMEFILDVSSSCDLVLVHVQASHCSRCCSRNSSVIKTLHNNVWFGHHAWGVKRNEHFPLTVGLTPRHLFSSLQHHYLHSHFLNSTLQVILNTVLSLNRYYDSVMLTFCKIKLISLVGSIVLSTYGHSWIHKDHNSHGQIQGFKREKGDIKMARQYSHLQSLITLNAESSVR